jgi:hypothetical protein
MTFDILIALIAFPMFGGLLLWLTSRLEERVAGPARRPVRGVVPSDSTLAPGGRPS